MRADTRPTWRATIGALLLLLLSSPAALSQARDASHALVTTFGGGWSFYAAAAPPGHSIQRNGVAVSARMMWHPNRRLRIGVETGWTRLYNYRTDQVETSFGVTDADLSLTAVPMLLVFSMPVWQHLELSAGFGVYHVNSHARSFGLVVDVTEFSQGWMVGASWTVPLSSRLAISADVALHELTQFEDAMLHVQTGLQWRVLEW